VIRNLKGENDFLTRQAEELREEIKNLKEQQQQNL
jgi:predicted ATP-grasp superfamily ATP-dependent carboligase